MDKEKDKIQINDDTFEIESIYEGRFCSAFEELGVLNVQFPNVIVLVPTEPPEIPTGVIHDLSQIVISWTKRERERKQALPAEKPPGQ